MYYVFRMTWIWRRRRNSLCVLETWASNATCSACISKAQPRSVLCCGVAHSWSQWGVYRFWTLMKEAVREREREREKACSWVVCVWVGSRGREEDVREGGDFMVRSRVSLWFGKRVRYRMMTLSMHDADSTKRSMTHHVIYGARNIYDMPELTKYLWCRNLFLSVWLGDILTCGFYFSLHMKANNKERQINK